MKKIIFVLCTLALFTLFFACKVEDAGAAADTGTNSHTVTIVLNEGMGVSDQPQKIDDGQTFTIGNPSKAGYVFKGWSTTNKLDNLDFVSGSTHVNSDITIYAMFNKLYNVVINTNGATPATITKQVEAGTKVTLVATEIPTKLAYTLSGYKDGNSVAFDIASQVVNSDLNLTMQWTVDLAAIRDILTGGTTTGVKWLTGTTTYIRFFKPSSSTNPLEVSYEYNLFGNPPIYNTVLEIVPSSDSNSYLAKFNPPITSDALNYEGDYLISLTLSEITYHNTNGTGSITATKE